MARATMEESWSTCWAPKRSLSVEREPFDSCFVRDVSSTTTNKGQVLFTCSSCRFKQSTSPTVQIGDELPAGHDTMTGALTAARARPPERHSHPNACSAPL
eukprot:5642833-Prymnesium_polylepis.2